ncbi:NAD-dependent epimerase/dehydratase family protein [Fictibacillus fluitans]|uniref:NAD-dependent epimerase/dehydratase family protein n=1 Tax=Fictibacillus fluitans TaxID=3058422 RepID=A0ABT8I335_9BACL|nr:NAD-dependent epimerase/dehydratase family protein [Fictibacillus sp. NE201]MDN4527389.1 NAD-dependent epimerase/dehydratase family protein [Fictibacillus sp. NE201]
MHVFVIGGTRFMGPEVIKRLIGLGHKVTVFHRGKTKAELPSQVNTIQGDRNHLPSFRNKIQEIKPDAVLDMMCMTEIQANELLQTIDGIVNRVIVVSSQDVYRAFGRVNGTEDGEAEPVPIDENGELRHNLYPRRAFAENEETRMYDKILVERTIMDHHEIKGTVLRLPAVYGPNDPQHRWYSFIKPMSDQRPYILLAESFAGWRWTRGYVENMAEAIVQSILNPEAADKIYNVGEKDAWTTKEWIETFAPLLNWSGKIVVLPDDQLPEGYSWGINAEQHVIFTSDKIRHELGYNETVSFEEGLKRTIDWELQHPPEKQTLDYDAENKIMKQQNINTNS